MTLSSHRIALLLSLLACVPACGDALEGEERTILRRIHLARETGSRCAIVPQRFTLATQEVKEHADRLELRRVVLRVADPATDSRSVARSVQGTLKVSSDYLNPDALVVGRFEDLALTQGNEVEFPATPEVREFVAQKLQSPEATFWVEAYACVDALPAFFDVDVRATFFADW